MNGIIPILVYHAVGEVADQRLAPFTIDRERFAEHLHVLVDRGLALRTISDLLAERDAGSTAPLAAITFDDGVASFATDAWPELARHNIPATLYITTATVGSGLERRDTIGDGSTPMLSWSDVLELDRAGCEIGAHSVSHPHLDCVAGHRARAEIEQSRDSLSGRLGHRIASFAYPHGYFDRATRDLVVAAGFDSACAVRNAWSHRDDDRFALARLTVTADVTADQLAAALDGRRVRPAAGHQLLRTRAYRHVRRWRSRRAAVADDGTDAREITPA